jgi:hypothetical protein
LDTAGVADTDAAGLAAEGVVVEAEIVAATGDSSAKVDLRAAAPPRFHEVILSDLRKLLEHTLFAGCNKSLRSFYDAINWRYLDHFNFGQITESYHGEHPTEAKENCCFT